MSICLLAVLTFRGTSEKTQSIVSPQRLDQLLPKTSLHVDSSVGIDCFLDHSNSNQYTYTHIQAHTHIFSKKCAKIINLYFWTMTITYPRESYKNLFAQRYKYIFELPKNKHNNKFNIQAQITFILLSINDLKLYNIFLYTKYTFADLMLSTTICTTP